MENKLTTEEINNMAKFLDRCTIIQLAIYNEDIARRIYRELANKQEKTED